MKPGSPGFAEPIHFVLTYAFRQREPETDAMIALAARSMRLAYPAARVVLLTNALGMEAGLPAAVERRQIMNDAEQLMLARVEAFGAYIDEVQPGTVVVFMDCDMLVVGRFDEVLAPGADIVVTARAHSRWPINAGLVVARTDDPDAARRFFAALLAACRSLSDEDRRWYGDQVALAQVLRPPAGRLASGVVEARDGFTVRFMPGRYYNHTPKPHWRALLLFRPGARILHFKGATKRLMGAYGRLYLSPPYRALRRLRGR